MIIGAAGTPEAEAQKSCAASNERARQKLIDTSLIEKVNFAEL